MSGIALKKKKIYLINKNSKTSTTGEALLCIYILFHERSVQFIKFYLVAGKGFKKLIYSSPQKNKKKTKTPFSFSGDLFFRQICPRSRDSVGRSQCRHIKHNHDWLALHVIHTKLAFSRVRLSTNASHEFQVVLDLTRSEKKKGI